MTTPRTTAPPAADTVNRKALLLAFAPVLISLLLAGWFYYTFVWQPSQPKVVRIGVGSSSGDLKELLEATARMLRERDASYDVRLVRTSGSNQTIKRLDAGEIDFAAVSADALTRPSFTLIANLFPDAYHLIVHRNSPILTVPDLPGRVIAIPPVTSTANRSFWFLIGQYGLSPERMRTRAMSERAAFEAFRRGRVEAMFVVAPPGDRRLRWLAEAASIRIIRIDQAAAMQIRRPALSPVEIPRGIYSGGGPVPAVDTPSVAANRILITRADTNADIVRAVTATLFENRRELAVFTRLAAFISQPDRSGATVLPLHPGARAYYDRDQPSFFQENAEPIGVTFSIIAIVFSGLMWLKRRWEERQKGRIDVYNMQLVELFEQVRGETTPAALAEARGRLFAMLSSVIHDLDEDRIDGEGFHFFAFTWEAALSAIRDAERALGIASSSPTRDSEALAALHRRAGKAT